MTIPISEKPIRYRYKTKPFSHQKRALNKIIKLKGNAALLMEMGTGKTKVAIDWAGIGFYNYGFRRVLVVAPLSVLGVWPRQIRQHSTAPARLLRLEGSTDHRVSLLRKLQKTPNDDVLTYVVINYEGLWRETARGVSIRDLLIGWKPDLVVFDESHRIKSPTAKQSRAAYLIAKSAPSRLILTGTAITKSPLDVFSQFRVIDDKIFGSNWSAFKYQFGVWGGFHKYQLKGYRNVNILTKRVRAHSYRVTKAECLDLPEKLYETVPVVLPDSFMKLYKQMAEEMIIELEEAPATAAIVLVKLLRLCQMTSGFVKDVEKVTRILDDSKLKVCIDLLGDLLEEDHKVVIFVRFRTDIERIAEKLAAQRVSHRILSGSVPPLQRDSIVQEFQEDPAVKVFIAQVQAGSLGIELTAADAAIFYSLDYNAANYWQAQDRLHRVGQTKKVTYYHLVATGTIDRVLLRVLKDKEDIAKAILHSPRALLGT